MRTIKEIIETTIIENEKETKTKRVVEHIIRSWDELSREEKEKEIEKRHEQIYEWYQEDMYNIYKESLEMLKEDFPHIDFEDIYLDSNSQGWWIDRIKDFKYNTDDIEIYGEKLWVDYVDFRIRKIIEDFDINIDDYYVSEDKLRKIITTKKYQKWYEDIKKDIQNWIDRLNVICATLGNAEYYYPYNLDNENDKDWLDNYFSDEEFTDTREVFENDKN